MDTKRTVQFVSAHVICDTCAQKRTLTLKGNAERKMETRPLQNFSKLCGSSPFTIDNLALSTPLGLRYKRRSNDYLRRWSSSSWASVVVLAECAEVVIRLIHLCDARQRAIGNLFRFRQDDTTLDLLSGLDLDVCGTIVDLHVIRCLIQEPPLLLEAQAMFFTPIESDAVLQFILRRIPFVRISEVEVLVAVIHNQSVVIVYPLAGVGLWIP